MDRNVALAYGIASLGVALAGVAFFATQREDYEQKPNPVVVYVDSQGRPLRPQDDAALLASAEVESVAYSEEEEEEGERGEHERGEHERWGDDD